MSDDITIVEYNGGENWLFDGGSGGKPLTIIIFGLDGKPIEIKDVVFYDPIKGFIQSTNILYVPKLNLKEEPNVANQD